ncbi:MAG: hypothetical protein ACRES5_21140 [Pseudomonas sp.]|uniref:hypothetical protein n=1 Tax=Stenotrophomonas sp. TaxID=69392 RepID=UPI003D6CA579
MNTPIIVRAKLISSIATVIGWWMAFLFSLGWTSTKLIISNSVTAIDFAFPLLLTLFVIWSSGTAETFGCEILHTLYSGAGVNNGGWAISFQPRSSDSLQWCIR